MLPVLTNTQAHTYSHTHAQILFVKECCWVMTSWSVTGKIGAEAAIAKGFVNVIMLQEKIK